MEDKPWEPLVTAFVAKYYETFDSDRASVVQLYHPDAYIQFENHFGKGHKMITQILTEKVQFRVIQHIITKVDSQPTLEGGVIIVVTGRLKADDDPPHAFSQTFYIRPFNNNYFLCHDFFRLSIHDSA